MQTPKNVQAQTLVIVHAGVATYFVYFHGQKQNLSIIFSFFS